MSVATTGIENLSVAATASDLSRHRPEYERDTLTTTHEAVREEPSEEEVVKKKSKSHTRGKKTEKRPEKHPRSERTPPKEARPGKRKSGKEARDDLDETFSLREK